MYAHLIFMEFFSLADLSHNTFISFFRKKKEAGLLCMIPENNVASFDVKNKSYYKILICPSEVVLIKVKKSVSIINSLGKKGHLPSDFT